MKSLTLLLTIVATLTFDALAIDFSTMDDSTQMSPADNTISLITTTLWTGIGDMVVSGDQLVARGGLGYQIYDITQPNNITLIGQTILNLFGEFACAGEYAYVLRGTSGISWLDYSDPNDIFEVGHFQQWGGSVTDIAFMGKYAFIANGYYQGEIVDVSNATSWAHKGYIAGGEDVAVDSPYVYYSFAGTNTISIFDVSDINNPQRVGTYPASGDLEVANGFCYVADPDTGLVILNVANPANPQRTAIFPHPFFMPWFKEVKLRGDTAFVLTAYYPSVIGIDVSDPYHPTQTGQFSGSSYGKILEISGDILFTSSGDAVALDVSSVPWQAMDTIGLGYDNENISISGNLASVACGYAGVRILDLSAPQSPQLLGSYRAKYRYVSKAVQRDTLLYMLTTSLLYVLNISDPSFPDSVAAYKLPHYSVDLSVSDDLAYVLDLDSGLQIVDIHDPLNPQFISAVDILGSPRCLWLAASVAYIAADSILYAVDITNPYNAVVIDSVEIGANIAALTASGSRVIGACSDSTLAVVDASNPLNLNLVDRIPFESQLRGVNAYLGQLLVSAGVDGIVILDANSMNQISSYNTPGNASVCAVKDSVIIVVDGGAVTILNAPFLRDRVKYPDLAIASDLQLIPEIAYSEQIVSVGVSIRNMGSTVSEPFQVVLTSDRNGLRRIVAPIIIYDLGSGADTTIYFYWGADSLIDTLYAIVDPNNVIGETDESNNLLARPVNVLSNSGLQLFVSPSMLSASFGDSLSYNVTVINQLVDAHAVAITTAGLDQFQARLSQDTLHLEAGEWQNVQLRVLIESGCVQDTGLFNFTVNTHAVDDPFISASGGAAVYVSEATLFSNILPQDGEVLATNRVTILWTTSLSSESRVSYKKASDTAYSVATGEPGTDHAVFITDLDYDSTYYWHIEATNGCGTSQSEESFFRTGRGVVFGSMSYGYTIRRSYNQTADVQVLNTDTEAHEILVKVINPYNDLIAGFTGDGSIDQVVSLGGGESKYIALGIHAQDAEQENYTLAFRLSSTMNDGGRAYDYAQANVHVIWPDTNFVLEDLGLDPATLIRSMRLQNLADSITDFHVSVQDAVGIDYLMVPQIEHAILGPGEAADFELIPTFQDTVSTFARPLASCEATVIATGAGKSVEYRLTNCCDKQIYLVTKNEALLCIEQGIRSWYCTNRPDAKTSFQLPFLGGATVNSATFSVECTPRTSGLKNHTVSFYLNGNLIGRLENTIPNGTYEFEFDPSYLNNSSSGPAKNLIEIIGTNFNRGHYAINTNMSLCLCLSDYSEYICANSEAEASDILNSRPYLFDAQPTSVTILQPADGATIPKFTGTAIEVDIEPAHSRYEVQAELFFSGGINQVASLYYDTNSHTYKTSIVPDECSDATLEASALICGESFTSSQTLHVNECEQTFDKTLLLLDANGEPIANKEFQVYRVAYDPPTFTQTPIGTSVFVSDDQGRIILPEGSFVEGDSIKIERNVHTEPARRHVDDLGTMYTVWIDNADFNTTTGGMSYDALDGNSEQAIQVNHATLCYNLLVAVEWDAEVRYLEDLQKNFRMMSNYLYDVSDGQIRLDTVEIYDDARVYENGSKWLEPDYRINADNSIQPVDYLPPGGIYRKLTGAPVVMPRKYFGPTASLSGVYDPNLEGRNASLYGSMDLTDNDDHRTKAHEFGHYALGFYDEYICGLVKNIDNIEKCCRPPYSIGFMDGEFRSSLQSHSIEPYASEMSSMFQYSDVSCPDTKQAILRDGLSCWGYLKHNIGGSWDGINVFIKAPEDQILSPGYDYFGGPNDDLTSLDYDVGALIIFPVEVAAPSARTILATVRSIRTGEPLPRTTIRLVKGGAFGFTEIKQGETSDGANVSGIYILGYEDGDAVKASGLMSIWHWANISLEETSSAQGAGSLTTALYEDSAVIYLQPVEGDYPVVNDIDISPAGLNYRITAHQAFANPPIVDLHTQNTAVVGMDMIYSNDSYNLHIDADLGVMGHLTTWAEDDSASTFFYDSDYCLYDSVHAENDNTFSSCDGQAVFYLDSLNSIQRSMVLSTAYPSIKEGLPFGAVCGSKTYAFSAYPNDVFVGANVVKISYDAAALYDSTTGCDRAADLQLFQWNNSARSWEPLTSYVDLEMRCVYSQISNTGVFVLFTSGDDDNDGVPNSCDACPGFDDNEDIDQDAVPDSCDNCPYKINPDQADYNSDGIGDACCCGIYTDGYTGNTDCDVQGKMNLADVIRLIDRIYLSQKPLCCEANGNVDGTTDGKLKLGDVTGLIDHIYLSKLLTAPCP